MDAHEHPRRHTACTSPHEAGGTQPRLRGTQWAQWRVLFWAVVLALMLFLVLEILLLRLRMDALERIFGPVIEDGTDG